ncbi:MAG: tetratricopeptide repeat protein [Candidatus Hydrogenedentota bacterium]
MVKRISTAIIMFICYVAVLHSQDEYVVCKDKDAELRARPNILAKVTGRLKAREKSKILEKTTDKKWFYIEKAGGVKGWVYENYVDVIKEGEWPWIEGKKPPKELLPLRKEIKELFEKAQKLNLEKKFDECLEVLNQIIMKDPQNRYGYTERARFGKGVCYMGLKENEKSSIAFLEFIKRYPENERIPEAYYYTILNYYEIGLEKAGEEKLLILAKEFPDSEYTKKTYDFVVGEYQLKKKKNFDKAIELLEFYINTNSKSKYTNQIKFQLANIYKVKGSFRRAETLFREITSSVSGTPLAYQAEDNIIDIFMMLRDYDAVIDYIDSLKSDNISRKAVNLANKAQAYYLKGEIEAAVKIYEELIDNYSKTSVADNVLKSLANIYFSRYSNYEKAITLYNKILQEYSQGDAVADALYGLANSYYLSGCPQTALSYFKQLKEKYPDKAKQLIVDVEIKNIETNLEADSTPFLLYIQGLNLERKYKFQEAREKYLKVVNDYPKAKISLEALYKIAITFIEEKDYNSAVPYLKKIVEDYPDTVYGKDAQKKLNHIAKILKKTEKK